MNRSMAGAAARVASEDALLQPEIEEAPPHPAASRMRDQARPWLTRERRASESTMTAMASTPPVIM